MVRVIHTGNELLDFVATIIYLSLFLIQSLAVLHGLLGYYAIRFYLNISTLIGRRFRQRSNRLSRSWYRPTMKKW